MSTSITSKRVSALVAAAVILPIRTVRYAAGEPLLTGGFLYALTRAPLQYRQRFLSFLTNRGLSAERLATLIKALQVLLAVGVVGRLNRALNRLALNHWHLGKPGAPYQWGPTKSELVVITGGSSGFGYEMAKGFVKHARVIVLDINPLPVELAAIPGVHYYRLDVTESDTIAEIADAIRREHGNPSVLINNAGIATGKKIIEATAKSNDAIFKVNISSHILLIKEFLPAMLQAKKGHVVTVASMASFLAAPGLVDYCATKAAALVLHEGLRAELRDFYQDGKCIQTTCVHPTWHSTGIVKPYESKLLAAGIKFDPAANVSNAIIEQVLAGRSGQIFVPKEQENFTRLRQWPLWAQDLLGLLTRKKVRALNLE